MYIVHLYIDIYMYMCNVHLYIPVSSTDDAVRTDPLSESRRWKTAHRNRINDIHLSIMDIILSMAIIYKWYVLLPRFITGLYIGTSANTAECLVQCVPHRVHIEMSSLLVVTSFYRLFMSPEAFQARQIWWSGPTTVTVTGVYGAGHGHWTWLIRKSESNKNTDN